MCGIAGIVNGERDASRTGVEKMLETLERRGPDDGGVEEWEQAVFGHRRLSIFDLSSAGHQPMLAIDGRSGIVLNGAIYNFRDLRTELEDQGCKFRSGTDTEVLLEGYREWGIKKLLSKIEGMFAFAIWDDAIDTLFMVRDRLGVKPLVYSRNGNTIAFASTIRALRNAGFAGSLSNPGLVEYLEFGFVTDSGAIYDRIEKVPPASLVTVRKGTVSVEQYWQHTTTIDTSIGFEEAVEETERLFLASVEKRLFADVPVGALLSGGIDSSLVCWAVAKLGGDVAAFTVGVPGDKWDETSIAASTAKQLGIEHRVLEISGATPFDLGDLSSAYSEPFACASALGLIDISREVKKYATVLLTGDGGDDVFLGYPEHMHFHKASQLARATPEIIGTLIRHLSDRLPGSGRVKRARSFLSYAYGGLGGVTRARDGLPFYADAGLLGDALKDSQFPDRGIPLTHGNNLLADFLTYDLKTRFTGEYLTKVDGGTMHHALEARSPLLDHELWAFAEKLPFGLRMKSNRPKAILREIVKRRIGPELAAGAKQGFGVPVQRWLTKEWNQMFRDRMADSRIEALGLINTNAALRSLDESEKSGWAPR